MSKIVFSLFIGLLLLISNCKKTPTLSFENELDPFSNAYTVLPPNSFSLFSDYSSNQLFFQWNHSVSEFINGYRITASSDSIFDENDVSVFLTNLENKFVSSPLVPTFQSYYKIETYLDKPTGRVFSTPNLISSSNFGIVRYEISQNLDTVRIAWNDTFVLENVSIQIQESFKNSEFMDIYNSVLNGDGGSFTHVLNHQIQDYEFRHKFYTATDDQAYVYNVFGSRTNCTEVEVDEPFFSPNQYWIDELSNNSIRLRWFNFDYCVDQFILYEGENGSGRERLELQRISGDENEFLVENLNPDIIYQFWIVGVVNGRVSAFDCPIEVKFENGVWNGKLIPL